MRHIRRMKRMFPVALAAFLTVLVVSLSSSRASSGAGIPLSDNLGSVPVRDNVVLNHLPSGMATVSPDVAIAAAERLWGFSDAQVDRGSGVVRTTVTIKGDIVHQNLHALLVVADVQLPNFAPRSNTRYQKIVVVVDAVTGKVILSYPVEPVGVR